MYYLFRLYLLFGGMLLGLQLPRSTLDGYLIGAFLLVGALGVLKLRRIALMLFALAGLFIGQARGLTAWEQLQRYDKFVGQKVSFTATAQDDAVYGYLRQVEFYAENVVLDGIKLPGKIRIRGYGVIEVKRGDEITVTGKMRDGFGSYQASINYAEYEVTSRTSSKLEDFRHRFIADSYGVLPEPHASLGLGFLAGFQSLLPEQLSDDLSSTGLTHIVAVSGYNTTILAGAVQRILSKKGSRYQVVIATSLLLVTFLAITGLAPSIIRASVVSVMSLMAWYFGRTLKPSVLLVASAALTAWVFPLHFWFSLGWWLSFLAFIGVLVLAPLIKKRFFKERDGLLLNTLLETTCAQIMTLPLIVWVFNQVSVISLLANLMVLPTVPFAMLATFIAGLSATYLPVLAGILAWPARWVLSYIVDIITLLARAPWAKVDLAINTNQMVVLYVVVCLVTVTLYLKLKNIRT